MRPSRRFHVINSLSLFLYQSCRFTSHHDNNSGDIFVSRNQYIGGAEMPQGPLVLVGEVASLKSRFTGVEFSMKLMAMRGPTLPTGTP